MVASHGGGGPGNPLFLAGVTPTLRQVIILFGTRVSIVNLLVVTFVCNFCGQNVQQQVYKRVNRFTVFFIPLFSLSTKHFVTCSNCGGTTELTPEQANNALSRAGQQGAI